MRLRLIPLLLVLASISLSQQNAPQTPSASTAAPEGRPSPGYAVAAAFCFLAAFGLGGYIGYFLYKRLGWNKKLQQKAASNKEGKTKEKGGKPPPSQEQSGPTPIPNKFRIPAKDIQFKGPLKMQKRYRGEADHDFEGKEEVEKKRPDKIVFDPALNEAVEIGEGVEIIEKSKHGDPKSAMSVSQGGDLLENVPLPEEKTAEDKKEIFYV